MRQVVLSFSLAASVGAWSSPAAADGSPVTISIRPRVVAAKGGLRRVVVDVDVKNRGPRKVLIDPDGAFACGGWQPDIRMDRPDGTDVPYIGPEVQLPEPPKKEELGPGAQLSIRGLDITELFYYPKEPIRLAVHYSLVVVDGNNASQVQASPAKLDYKPVTAREPGSTSQAAARSGAGAGSRTIRCQPPIEVATGKPVR
jgi:hypothetical protein